MKMYVSNVYLFSSVHLKINVNFDLKRSGEMRKHRFCIERKKHIISRGSLVPGPSVGYMPQVGMSNSLTLLLMECFFTLISVEGGG